MVLETKRLILRRFEAYDAKSMFELNNDPKVIRYTGDQPFSSMEAACDFILSYDHYSTYGFGRWAVVDKKRMFYLGWCGLKYTPSLGETDLGFRFFQKYWNKGFATEAAFGCLKYGFRELGLSTIVGRARRENHPSIKVMTKIGMQFKKSIIMDGHPGVQYQMDRSRLAPIF